MVGNSTRATSPRALLTGALSLQDLGDLRLLFKSYPGPLIHRDYDPVGAIVDSLDDSIGAVVQETIAWARHHEAEGRYRDAEYFFRRASSDENIPAKTVDPYQNEDVLPDLVSTYERIGDYPAAEMVQEGLLRRLCAKKAEEASSEQIQAAGAYARLLSLFQKRIVDLYQKYMRITPSYVNLFITYRAAVLDIIHLNEILVENGLIPLESADDDCCTPLHIAARENAIHLARVLIKNGANVNSRDVERCTPLHIAARYAKPDWGVTDLGCAVRNADIDIVEMLLRAGADVDKCDPNGNTVLHYAVVQRARNMILILIRHIKPDKLASLCQMRDIDGKTPLTLAQRAAAFQDESSIERSILFLLENALELSRSFIKDYSAI